MPPKNILKKLFPELKVLDWGKKPSICNIVINTTSVGLIKDEEIKIDFSDYDNNLLFYDLIYNPSKSLLLKKSEENGATIINGYQMLENQAMESWKIWNSKH